MREEEGKSFPGRPIGKTRFFAGMAPALIGSNDLRVSAVAPFAVEMFVQTHATEESLTFKEVNNAPGRLSTWLN